MTSSRTLVPLPAQTLSHQITAGQLNDPKSVLGWRRMSASSEEVIVRTWNPKGGQVRLRVGNSPNIGIAMQCVDPAGLFESRVVGEGARSIAQGNYEFEYCMEGHSKIMPDPYAVTSVFGEFDFFLYGQGNHFRIYEKLGAHPREVNGETGVNFAVWAPNARQVTLIGSFNDWNGHIHPMQNVNFSGIWELFIPHAKPGDAYKFRVTDAHGHQTDKSDPYAFYAELPPRTASIVHDVDQFEWNDENWMNRRREQNQLQRPISVYELHLGSWRQRTGRPHGWIDYRTLAHEVVEYCRELNFTHIELLPVSEHPYTGSWGYQTTGYFAATSRYGNPDDFMYFVNHCHNNGLGVIIDWVPAHFPKDAHGLARFDGTALYEHADPRQGEHPDWSTLIFNYGRNEVRNFLVASALFWFDKYHIDGLRVDAVASMLYLDYSRKEGQWIPNHLGGRENFAAINLLQQFNREAHGQYPGVLTIAEESTAWPGVSKPTDTGGLGFSIKWNMGWMNDTLRYMRQDPIHRKYHHDQLTFSLVYAFSENFMLPFSHDEVVHGKRSLLSQMPGDNWQKFANLRLLYTYMWMHPGKKLMFMGCEFGQWLEWNCNTELDWALLGFEHHRGLQHLIRDLNEIYGGERALYELDFDGRGFEWIECHNRDDSRLVFVRRSSNGEELIVACNFTPIVRTNVRIGVPHPGVYRERINSDSKFYGGSNVGNSHELIAESIPFSGQLCSLNLTLPPLAAVVIKRDA
jgi:1,4-alpha-glucan branching enzyme